VQLSRHRCTAQAVSLPAPLSDNVDVRVVGDALYIDEAVVHMHVSLEQHPRRHAMASIRIVAP
jgi:hypothetical protein